jgi:hypothetical protein
VLFGQTGGQRKEDRSYAFVALRVPAESRRDTITRADFCPTKQQLGGECDDRSVLLSPAGLVLTLLPLFPQRRSAGLLPFALRAGLVRG